MQAVIPGEHELCRLERDLCPSGGGVCGPPPLTSALVLVLWVPCTWKIMFNRLGMRQQPHQQAVSLAFLQIGSPCAVQQVWH